MKNLFLLDPEVIFLNHGSFGATPLPVFDEYQKWQRELERQPVHFLAHEITPLLKWAREQLGDFINADATDLAFIPNTTFGVNVVARSLNLAPGDQILSNNQEYGACVNTWNFLCNKTQAEFIQQEIPLPVPDDDEFIDRIWAGVTQKTKAIFLSHITSETASQFPVKEICRRARDAGILSIIDGAHAPGQIPLDLKDIDADFYFGNCHKWMMSAKGAAFIYARPDKQHLVEPLVVGWGLTPQPNYSAGSAFLNRLQWLGTNDLSAYLSVPAAIEFQKNHDWDKVRQNCKTMLSNILLKISDLTKLPPPYLNDSFYTQMGIARLPRLKDTVAYKNHLYQTFKIEAPLINWSNQNFIRISVQGYNSQSDLDCLLVALEKSLPEFAETHQV